MTQPSNMFDLSGKVALVTGGAGSIGAAICQSMIDCGAKVVVADVKDFGQAKAEQFNDAADEQVALGVTLDVTDAANIQQAIDDAVNQFGSLDILVNCAGVNLKKPSLELTDEDERFVMEINYFGPVAASKAAAKQMIKQGNGGSIVNLCSVTSFMALSEVTPYACSKGALWALTRQLAVEWPRLYGIRVNAVAPGFVPAGQNLEILKSGDRGRRILEHTPMERFGTPDEIAGAVVYLCSPAGSFMNGACIKIDGGFMISGVSDATPQDDA